jgi:putative transposase
MARRLRIVRDDGVYHVLNRRVGRAALFEEEGDFEAFEKAVAEAQARTPSVRVLAYILMSNHWHLLLWPRRGKDLATFMQWLTVTHIRRWHARRGSAGEGPLYKGRFKSFPVQDDAHLLVVARFVERNALRAKLVRRAEQWRWSSLWRRDRRVASPWLTPPKGWPATPPRDYLTWVNRAEAAKELEAIQRSVKRGMPFGDPAWVSRTASTLKLQSTLRDPWRPKKRERPAKDKAKKGK